MCITKDKSLTFEEFYALLESLHGMKSNPFFVSYTDPKDGELLPINNDDNFARALHTATPLLRIILQRKGLLTIMVCFLFSINMHYMAAF